MVVHINRITTRTGDDGTTALADRSRVPKTDARIEALGTLDELCAAIGLAVDRATDDALVDLLGEIQQQMFDLGADLARPVAHDGGRHVGDDQIGWLEEVTAEAAAAVPPLRTFILPGGPGGTSELHLARAICRRAERRVLAVEGDTCAAAVYLNRLSDTLFALARRAAAGDERLWRACGD